MDVNVIVAIVGAIEGLGGAIIAGMFNRFNKRNEEYRAMREQRDEHREEKNACLYDLLFATASGTEVLLHAAHGDHMNGNVDEALRSLKKAKSECNHAFNRHAAKM